MTPSGSNPRFEAAGIYKTLIEHISLVLVSATEGQCFDEFRDERGMCRTRVVVLQRSHMMELAIVWVATICCDGCHVSVIRRILLLTQY
jgi:hypothetical protein